MPTTREDIQQREWERTQAEMFGWHEDRIESELPTLFTDEEWDVMLSDPRFGYVCGRGHRQSEGELRYGGCLTCESEAESAYYDYMDAHPEEFSLTSDDTEVY